MNAGGGVHRPCRLESPPSPRLSTAGLFFCDFPRPPGAPGPDRYLARCGALAQDEDAGGGSQLPLLAIPSTCPAGKPAGFFIYPALGLLRRYSFSKVFARCGCWLSEATCTASRLLIKANSTSGLAIEPPINRGPGEPRCLGARLRPCGEGRVGPRQTTTNGYADQKAVVRPGSPEVMSCLRLSRTIKSPTVTQRP